MKHNFTFFLLAIAAIATPAIAQTDNSQPVAEYRLDDLLKTAIPIVIAGDAGLAAHANKAFASHGAFRRVTDGGDYTLTFTPVAAAQVRVDIARKNAPTITSITADGASARDALYRAADAAVKHITKAPGYFTSKLAFVSNKTGKDEIYTGDLFLNEARDITNKRATILFPRWSPDGRKIIFTGFFMTNSADIFLLDIGTGTVTPYASFNGTNMGGRFSPDGSRVAFVVGIANGNTNLYIGSPDGRAKPTQITSSPDAKASPCFSPDGQRIVFTMEPGPQLHIMPASGGAPARIVTGVNYAAEPDWSRANPNLIAFTTKVGSSFRIAVHDLSTKKTRIINAKTATGAALSGDLLEPTWLPDGRHLVCTQRPLAGNQRFLYILDTAEKFDANGKLISEYRATQISALRAEQACILPQP